MYTNRESEQMYPLSYTGVYLGFSFLAIYEFFEVLVRSGTLMCKESNSVEQARTDDATRKDRNDIEQIYHIQTGPPPLPPARIKQRNREERKDESKQTKSDDEDPDGFKMQINSFYDNLYRMKNDLNKQTKPKSRWIKIIKEREF